MGRGEEDISAAMLEDCVFDLGLVDADRELLVWLLEVDCECR